MRNIKIMSIISAVSLFGLLCLVLDAVGKPAHMVSEFTFKDAFSVMVFCVCLWGLGYFTSMEHKDY